MSQKFDLIIVGGGLVGASLAAALRNTGIRIAVIEPYAFDADAQPSYDERTVALTDNARQIYTGMGIWEQIENAGVEPILDIHISNQGSFGITHLSHQDVGAPALGYVVPTRSIGRVLYGSTAQSKDIALIQPASAQSLQVRNSRCVVMVDKGREAADEINASLVVIADGGRSGLTKGLGVDEHVYDQQALLSIVEVDTPHHGRAYERFTKEGPLALLPHQQQRYAVVWTCAKNTIDKRLAMSNSEFLEALQDAFGDRAGIFTNPSPRKTYPLSRNHLGMPARERIVAIGNAAHTVHPVAGQGFNLGLRDVAWLAEHILGAFSQGDDIGNPAVINAYTAIRKRDTRMVSCFTHGLISAFSNDFIAPRLLRNFGLMAIELYPPAKRFSAPPHDGE